MSRRPTPASAVVLLAQFLVVLDGSVVSVALPNIRDDLHVTAGHLQWVSNAYVLSFGAFLLLGGRCADVFGARRLFLLGTASFFALSLACAAAWSGPVLIAARALQGLSAAALSPAALALLSSMHPDGPERNAALGLWGAVTGVAATVGLILGGAITDLTGWRGVFAIGVPAAATLAACARRLLPADPRTMPRKLDLPGAALATLSLLALVASIQTAQSAGLTSAATLALFVIALLAAAAFALAETRAPDPLVRLSLLRQRNLAGANVLLLALGIGLAGGFFLLTIYFQAVLGYDALTRGLALLPTTAGIAIASTAAGPAVSRFGLPGPLVIGLLLMAAGLALLRGCRVTRPVRRGGCLHGATVCVGRS